MENAFLQALKEECPLQIVGTINAYTTLLAKTAGFKAIYLSGAGVANACFGLPDLGVTQLEDVMIEVKRLRRASQLPLLVDVDTGWDDITQTVKALESAGADAIHIEDQVEAKRCGHLEGKQLVSTQEMQQRIQKATSANTNLAIMARTDAYTVEGLEKTLIRAQAYIDAGAQCIFFEAPHYLQEIKTFCQKIRVPVLINLTEFGQTPLFSIQELKEAGAAMLLYPLSAFRAMNASAKLVYETIRTDGNQSSVLEQMQSRSELYDYLHYEYWQTHRDELVKPKSK